MKRLGSAVCVLFAGISVASAETISIQPPSLTVPAGSPVAVHVNVFGLSDLFAFGFDIGFDPAVLSATSVTEGALFSGIGISFSPGFIDNTAGMITFIGDSLSGPGPGLSTDGVLATIHFTPIGVGTSAIDLANVILLDSFGRDLDIDATTTGGEITVTAAAVPEPATWGLLVTSLLAGFAVRAASRGRRG